jgi:hypothetical protein
MTGGPGRGEGVPDEPLDAWAGARGEPHDPETCSECASELAELERFADPDAGGVGDLRSVVETEPDPDLGEIVVILLVSTLAGLRDRLDRDGFDSAAALVHDLVEVADDYVMRFRP